MKIPWRTAQRGGTATALIDTGCRVGLLARSGLIEAWTPALRPLSFTTASGAHMSGGLRGANFHLTVTLEGENGLFPGRLGCNWGYEADLSGVDMIIGYPLLACFGMIVDAHGHCLRQSS